MVRSISVIILFMCHAVVTAQHETASNDTYNIRGAIDEQVNGLAYLEYHYNDQDVKDSTAIHNGEFTFTGQIPEPILANIRIAETSQRFNFFLENKELKIRLKDGNLFLSGSSNHKVWQDWSTQWREKVHVVAGDIYKRLNEAYEKEGVDQADPDAKLSEKTRKAFDAEFAALNTTTDSILYPLARENPNSVVIPFIALDRYINYNQPEKAEDIFALLSDNVKNSIYGRQLLQALEKDRITAIGAIAPDFTQTDRFGSTLTLSNLRGKYVYLDFWASWCGPCRKENPNVVRLYEKYHQKGLEILGVSLDTKKEAWLKAIKDDKLTWLHVSDLQGWKNEAVNQYGIKTVPATYLLDEEGRILARNIRGEELEAKLSELLD